MIPAVYANQKQTINENASMQISFVMTIRLNWHTKKHKECYLELSLFPSISRSKASSSLDDIPPASLSLQSSKTSKPSPREKLTSAIAVEFKRKRKNRCSARNIYFEMSHIWLAFQTKPMKICHQSNKITRNGFPVPSRNLHADRGNVPGEFGVRSVTDTHHYENVHKSTRAQSNMYNICYYSVTRVTLLVQQNSKLLCQSCTLYGDFNG